MKQNKTTLSYISFFIPEIFFVVLVVIGLVIYKIGGLKTGVYLCAVMICLCVLFIIRMVLVISKIEFYYKPRIDLIKSIIKNFKHGHYLYWGDEIKDNDDLSKATKDLIVIGKHIENTIASQQSEISRFHEFYSTVVFPAGAYLIVLDDDEKIIFVNDRFCQRFHFDRNSVMDKRLDELFFHVNIALQDGITWAKEKGIHVVLEKIRLISLEKIPIIVDINVSTLDSAGQRQVVLILDDERSRKHNDYHLSLMSRIADSVKSGGAIENIFSTLLTGVTSGSGLGFNRAMLFLLNDAGSKLVGKMAVGPDSLDEAIGIWNSIAESGGVKDSDAGALTSTKGVKLRENVLKASFPMNKDNVFVRALVKNESQHVSDSYIDGRVDEKIKELMDVKEFVVVPISTMNWRKGILVVDNKFNTAPISDYNIELLGMFAMQAAFSMESYDNVSSLKKGMGKLFRKQDAIVEAEKMAAIGRLAAHIAHEIRNPLVTIGGYARRIANRDFAMYLRDDADEMKRFANIILFESERLEKILSNSMDFAKPAQQIKEFNDINEVIDDTLNLLNNYLFEKKVKVEVQKDETAPLVKSDFNQLKQVLLNLIQNSVDAMPNGGTINIIITHDSQYLTMKVQDQGSGFAMAHFDQLFKPFFTTKPMGIGLGLSNIKKIIKDHKGIVDAKNMPDGGAEFIVQLPIPG